MAALKGYVTARDELHYAGLAAGTVAVHVTHNLLKARVVDLRLDLSSSIAEIKHKLYTHNGSNVDYMVLQLRRDGVVVCEMLDDTRPLGFYGVENGMEIHVIDNDPFSLAKGGGLEDVSQVAKYRMSEEDYDKRENTLRSYKKKMLEKDPTFRFFPKKDDEGKTDKPDCESKECVEGIEVGNRCEVAPGARRGAVAYVGPVEGLASGYWVGVKFDEPVGKGDGTRDGKRYFECDEKYGAFVRPYNVTVGDFPEEDLFGSDDEDEI